MGYKLSGTDKERIRGFVADFEEKNPYPQSTQKQYEWWISAISSYVHHLQYENVFNKSVAYDLIRDLEDKFRKVKDALNEFVGNAEAQNSELSVGSKPTGKKE